MEVEMERQASASGERWKGGVSSMGAPPRNCVRDDVRLLEVSTITSLAFDTMDARFL